MDDGAGRAPRGSAREAEHVSPLQRRAPPPLHAGCALFLDIDGTLLELASAPDRVYVDAGIARLLPLLARQLGGAVALVTGRALADADRLFGGLSLPVAGQHGLERRAADGSLYRHRPLPAGIERMRRDLARFAARHKGLRLEDKGATFAVHYREAPRLAPHVHRTMRAHLAAATSQPGWKLQPGKGLVEIGPGGRDKGTAIVEYLKEPPFAGRLPVFVGDDRTDEYGFVAVVSLGGWAVKVGPGRTNAQFRLADVSAVRRWLAALVPAGQSD